METKKRLIQLLDANGIFVDSESNDDIDLREYIIDSIQFISFIVEIEKEFDIEFPDEALQFENIASLNGFANIIDSIVSGYYLLDEDDLADDIYSQEDDFFEV